jgi:hypothetical protein
VPAGYIFNQPAGCISERDSVFVEVVFNFSPGDVKKGSATYTHTGVFKAKKKPRIITGVCDNTKTIKPV